MLQIVNKEIKQMISAENVCVSNSKYLNIIKFSNVFFILVYYDLIFWLNSEENANDNLVDNNSDIWNYH